MNETFDIKSTRLLEKIDEELKELHTAYGRKLTGAATTNVHIQRARGQYEALQRVKVLIRNLTCPDFPGIKKD